METGKFVGPEYAAATVGGTTVLSTVRCGTPKIKHSAEVLQINDQSIKLQSALSITTTGSFLVKFNI